jgi:hypothetical protein
MMATYPAPDEVLAGVEFGPNDNDYTGTFHVPGTEIVLAGETYGPSYDLTGEFAAPETNDVRFAVEYGDPGSPLVGELLINETEYEAMAVTLALTGLINVVDNRSAENEDVRKKISYDIGQLFADGTGANQLDFVWSDRRTLAATSEEIDLVGGLVDSFGVAFSVAKLKFLAIINRSTTVGHNLEVGGASAAVPIFSAANDEIIVPPGGKLIYVAPSLAGIAVTATSADLLKVDAGANTISYDIILGGVKV